MGDTVEPLLTIQALATYLGIHPQTIYSMARKGDIPSVRIGRAWRFDREAVLAALDISNGKEGRRHG